MEMPFCETRPENGAELVPTDNSAPQKVDLSSKVSIGRGEKARSSGWGAAEPRTGPPRQHGPVSASPAALLFLFLSLNGYS